MPRFTGQNKKRIDPRYFLHETTSGGEIAEKVSADDIQAAAAQGAAQASEEELQQVAAEAGVSPEEIAQAAADALNKLQSMASISENQSDSRKQRNDLMNKDISGLSKKALAHNVQKLLTTIFPVRVSGMLTVFGAWIVSMVTNPGVGTVASLPLGLFVATQLGRWAKKTLANENQ
jgi:hypothetical protein